MKNLTKAFNATIDFYQRTHAMHWNITGIDFPSYHTFFGTIYLEVYASIDFFAEQLRACDVIAPSIQQAIAASTLPETANLHGTKAFLMLKELDLCNELILKLLNDAFNEATSKSNQGLADFISARIDAHNKHGWMIKSCLK